MRKFGLIGATLSHSFSKKYFADKFQALGITDCEYENYALRSLRAFPDLISSVPELEGLNVTVPYKEQIIPYLDHLEDAAAEIDAVNCIHFKKGKMIGYNTDVIGFENALLPLIKQRPDRALILGTGGAAKAVAYVLKKLGITYQFVSRREGGGNITYSALTEAVINSHRLIVNATPLGTSPNVEEAPDIPYGLLNKNHLLFDLIYNPGETRFLSLGRRQGAAIKNGYGMLVGQAEASWNIWNKD